MPPELQVPIHTNPAEGKISFSLKRIIQFLLCKSRSCASHKLINSTLSSARIHSLFESTNFSSQPRAIENKITTEKEVMLVLLKDNIW